MVDHPIEFVGSMICKISAKGGGYSQRETQMPASTVGGSLTTVAFAAEGRK